ncbi:MAG: DMT family transporter [Silicimonas sp.]|nr:DMT family transporter [Silicimonas sp.]
MPTDRTNLKAAALALGGFAVFATHDAVIKVLGATYSPFQILFFSVLFSFPLVALMLIRDREPGNLRPTHPVWIAGRTAAAILAGFSAFYAFSVLPLAQVYAFIFAAPLLITVLSIPILGERVGMHRWAAVVLGLAGVLIVLRPGAEPLTLGHIAGLTAALGTAFVSVITRKIGQQERSVVLMLYPMMANLLLMGLMLPFIYVPMPLDDLGLQMIVAMGGFGGSLFIIAAYRAGDAAIVAPMQYSQIIWGTLLGLFFFAETPDRYTGIGAGIVIAAGLYVVIRESFGGQSVNTPVLRTRTRGGSATSLNVGAFLRRTHPHRTGQASAKKVPEA